MLLEDLASHKECCLKPEAVPTLLHGLDPQSRQCWLGLSLIFFFLENNCNFFFFFSLMLYLRASWLWYPFLEAFLLNTVENSSYLQDGNAEIYCGVWLLFQRLSCLLLRKNRQMRCVHGSEDINGLFISRGVPQVNANWILVDLSLFGKVQSPHI